MTQRRTDVDVVRFLALVSMYVAHVAPVPGPAHVLELSEYLTMPLFAALVGVGAQLGARSVRGVGWWWSMLVRAGLLIGLGLALEHAGAQVVIVLVHLGVLVVLAGLLARLPSLVVVAVGAAAIAVGEVVLGDANGYLTSDTWTGDVGRFLWVGGPYRLLTMVLFAAVGIVLARWWVSGERRRSIALPGAVGVVLLVPAAAMLAAEQAGRIDLVPYSGTLQETVLDTLLAAAVIGLGLALGRVLERVGPLVGLLAAAGAMTLTLYVLQILWLAYDVRVLHPGARDDSWANLAALVVGSLVVAAAWPAVVRREPWRRGPLEGPVAVVARLVPRARR